MGEEIKIFVSIYTCLVLNYVDFRRMCYLIRTSEQNMFVEKHVSKDINFMFYEARWQQQSYEKLHHFSSPIWRQ